MMANWSIFRVYFVVVTLFVTLEISPMGGATGQIQNVRLVNGSSPNEGTVEYTTNDVTWQTACGVHLSIRDVIIICDHLGFPGANRRIIKSPFGAPTDLPNTIINCPNNSSVLGDCILLAITNCTDVGAAVCYDDTYLGCYVDDDQMHVLNGTSKNVTGLTIDNCKQLCMDSTENNYIYAGVEIGNECYCGDDTADFAQLGRASDSECQNPCDGNPFESCGGIAHVAVFEIPLSTQPPTTTSNATTPSFTTTPSQSTTSVLTTEMSSETSPSTVAATSSETSAAMSTTMASEVSSTLSTTASVEASSTMPMTSETPITSELTSETAMTSETSAYGTTDTSTSISITPTGGTPESTSMSQQIVTETSDNETTSGSVTTPEPSETSPNLGTTNATSDNFTQPVSSPSSTPVATVVMTSVMGTSSTMSPEDNIALYAGVGAGAGALIIIIIIIIVCCVKRGSGDSFKSDFTATPAGEKIVNVTGGLYDDVPKDAVINHYDVNPGYDSTGEEIAMTTITTPSENGANGKSAEKGMIDTKYDSHIYVNDATSTKQQNIGAHTEMVENDLYGV